MDVLNRFNENVINRESIHTFKMLYDGKQDSRDGAPRVQKLPSLTADLVLSPRPLHSLPSSSHPYKS